MKSINFSSKKSTSMFVAGILFGLCGSPGMAQSNVSISGFLDVGILEKSEGATQLGTIGRSNLAFSGMEDLGGGLAATFKLSTRFDLDTGTIENSDAQRPFFKDEATVGLKGSFGGVRLGRALSAVWQEAWKYDAWYNYDRIASPQWYAFAPDYLSNPQTREYGRMNNAVFYDSPSIGGFSARLAVAVDKEAADLSRGVSSSFTYADGPASLMLGLERNSQKDKLVYLGASYQFSNLKLMGGYSNVKLNSNGVIYSPQWTNWVDASNPTTKRTGLTLSAAYTAGTSTFKVGFARDFQGSTNGFNYIGSSFVKVNTNYSGPVNMGSLGYVYALSKRTNLLADLAYARWKFFDDNDRRHGNGYAIGMTHAF